MELNRFALALSVSEFLELQRAGSLVEVTGQGFYGAYGKYPSASELRAWESSFHALAGVLRSPEFAFFRIILEFNIPFLHNRVDIILLAGTAELVRGVIIELKAWTNAGLVDHSRVAVRVDPLGEAPHPCLQALQYRTALREQAKFESPVAFAACAYCYNIPSSSAPASVLTDPSFDPLTKEVPQFFADTIEALRRYLLQNLGSEGPRGAIASIIARGRFEFGESFIERLQRYKGEILNLMGMSTGLSITLAPDQVLVLDAIEAALQSGQRRAILVQGTAGSGKTILALYAVFSSIFKRRVAAYILVNAHLREVLAATFPRHDIRESIPPEAIIKPPSAISGPSKLDLAVCDEGQRLNLRDIQSIVKASRVSVFFYDARQRLNASEEGTEQNFEQACGEIEIQKLSLDGSRRIRAGSSYLQWLESLLDTPQGCKMKSQHPLTAPYEFRVCSSLAELIEALKGKRKQGHEVALLASFTESDGRSGNRHRASPPQIRWAMKGEYEEFWAKKGRNNLSNCASVYGAQGFEADYVGVIWGKDLQIGLNGWRIHAAHTITDYVKGAGPSLLDLVASSDPGERARALELLKHRYYIFLTRAARGVFIYCEDPDTAKFLTKLQ